MDGSIRIQTEIDTKSFDKQIEYLEQELEIMTKTLESDSKVDVSVRMSKSEKTKLERDIESVKNRIVSLQQKKDELNGERPQFTGLKEGFESAFKSAKRLVMGIVGVRSAYFLIRKASSAYLQSDSATTQQLENNWIGVGSLMQEIITGIVNAMKKLVTAVLYFAQQLTGVNYIARANANILKKQTKETNSLAKANDKLTASFDEMNTLQSKESYGGVSGGGIDESSLFDINDLSEDARKSIEKIGKSLKPVYDMIKDIIGWALKNPEAVIGILGGLALLSFLGKVLGVAGVGGTATGLLGIQGVLLGIASIGIIYISIKAIYDSVIKAREEIKGMTEVVTSANKESSNFAKQVKNDAKSFKILDNQVRIVSESFKNQTKNSLELAEASKQQYLSLNPLEKMIYDVTERTDSLTQETYDYLSSAYEQLEAWGVLYDQGRLNEEESKDYINALLAFDDTLKKSIVEVNGLSGSFSFNNSQSKALENQYKKVDERIKELNIKTEKTAGAFGSVAGSMNALQNPSKKTNEILKLMNDYMQGLINKKDVKLRIEADTYGARQALMNLTEGLPTFLKTTLRASFGNIKLAQGGIVNNPGRGVPIGSNVIAGEAGPEAVLPLDSETLGTLGKMIADNMVVNLTTVNKMDGRVLSREMQRVNANNDFAFNK